MLRHHGQRCENLAETRGQTLRSPQHFAEKLGKALVIVKGQAREEPCRKQSLFPPSLLRTLLSARRRLCRPFPLPPSSSRVHFVPGPIPFIVTPLVRCFGRCFTRVESTRNVLIVVGIVGAAAAVSAGRVPFRLMARIQEMADHDRRRARWAQGANPGTSILQQPVYVSTSFSISDGDTQSERAIGERRRGRICCKLDEMCGALLPSSARCGSKVALRVFSIRIQGDLYLLLVNEGAEWSIRPVLWEKKN